MHACSARHIHTHTHSHGTVHLCACKCDGPAPLSVPCWLPDCARSKSLRLALNLNINSKFKAFHAGVLRGNPPPPPPLLTCCRTCDVSVTRTRTRTHPVACRFKVKEHNFDICDYNGKDNKYDNKLHKQQQQHQQEQQ